ncbi:MAG: DUF3795 domain-containing protein [Bacteroidales bacterium]|nr:DUF3795 domain-containing protein [Bacteroidales bacterium]
MLIAPCGMNCGLCLAYLRDKNRCNGCRQDSTDKPVSCSKCIIANCEMLSKTQSKFCYDCEKYPCRRLKQLDTRYRTKYSMSMIENLEFIRDHGLESFVERENTRWACPVCGAILCVHRSFCLNCKEPRYDNHHAL